MVKIKVFVLCFMFFTTSVTAAEIRVIVSDDNAFTRKIITQIKQSLSLASPLLVSHFKDNWATKIANEDLLLIIGNVASKHVMDRGLKNPQIYSFVNAEFSVSKNSGYQWSVIPIEPSLAALFPIAQKIAGLRFKKRLVIALSENNESAMQQAHEYAQKYKNIDIVTIKSNETAAKKIKEHLYNAAALIAIRDKEIWSGSSAKWLLHQTYNHRVPVVGYSKSFLKAGALVSAYSSLKDIAAKTAEIITQWQQLGQISSQGVQSADYDIKVNASIARALGITKNETQLIERKSDVSILN